LPAITITITITTTRTTQTRQPTWYNTEWRNTGPTAKAAQAMPSTVLGSAAMALPTSMG
jgi:hypothetical protein